MATYLKHFLTSPSVGSTTQAQLDSIADRVVGPATSYAAFKTAAAGTPISPATATGSDINVTYSTMPTDTMNVIVKQPTASGPTFNITIDTMSAASARDQIVTQLENNTAPGTTFVFPAGQTIDLFHDDVGGINGTIVVDTHTDIVIDLNGCTLDLTGDPHLAFAVRDSSLVKIHNGTIHGNRILASIAQVSSLDGSGRPIFSMLSEYVTPLETIHGSDVPLRTIGAAESDGSGGWRLKIDPNDLYAEMFVNRGGTPAYTWNNTTKDYEPSGANDPGSPYDVGEHVWLLHENNTSHGIFLRNDGLGVEDITLEDIVMSNIPGMAIVGELRRGLYVNNVDFVHDAMSDTAIFAVSSDGLHINANGGDILVENCDFGPNGDDKINIKGNYWEVIAINGNEITVEPVDRETSVRQWGLTGDELVVIDGYWGLLGTTTMTSDAVESNDTHTFDVASTASIQIGSIIGNVSNAGSRVIIRDNTFTTCRAQGVLVQVCHIVLQNNHFDGIASPCIKLNMAPREWYEAINVDNVLLDSNTFTRSAHHSTKSNDLIEFHQVDTDDNPVDIISNVELTGNQAV